MKPRRATMKATIANGILKVARFLLMIKVSAGSDFFADVVIGVETGAKMGEVATIGGGSGIGFVAEVAARVGDAAAGAIVAAVARTGLGGKLSLGSFSKGAEETSSSPLVAGGLVFIYF